MAEPKNNIGRIFPTHQLVSDERHSRTNRPFPITCRYNCFWHQLKLKILVEKIAFRINLDIRPAGIQFNHCRTYWTGIRTNEDWITINPESWEVILDDSSDAVFGHLANIYVFFDEKCVLISNQLQLKYADTILFIRIGGEWGTIKSALNQR